MNRHLQRPSRRQRQAFLRASRQGFTLVEVLATLLLLAITLPAVMNGISLATRTAGQAERRTEAAGLGRAQLNQIVASGTWQSGNTTGNFGTDWPGYSWELTVAAWPQDTTNAGLQELDLKVLWKEHNRDASVTLSTLAYVRGQT